MFSNVVNSDGSGWKIKFDENYSRTIYLFIKRLEAGTDEEIKISCWRERQKGNWWPDSIGQQTIKRKHEKCLYEREKAIGKMKQE